MLKSIQEAVKSVRCTNGITIDTVSSDKKCSHNGHEYAREIEIILLRLIWIKYLHI